MGNQQSQQSSEVVLEERPAQTFTNLLESHSLKSDPTFGIALAKDLGKLTAELSRRGEIAEKKEDVEGFGVAHLCCVLLWHEGLRACLQAGALVDATSRSGYTPLHLACYFGSTECCRILLEHGARRDLRSRRGSLAIHLAAQQKCKAVLELLIDGSDPRDEKGGIDSPGFRSRTPLHLAVLLHGDPGVINLLIDAGAKVSEPNPVLNGITPLHTAAHYARVEAMRCLLQANADPNITSDDGVSPLLEVFTHPGMRHNEEALREMFTLLRDAGATLSCLLPRQGYSLLHLAMMVCNDESTLEALLDSGVNPSLNVDKHLSLFDPRSKSTMLHRAAKKGWSSVLKRLLAAGADFTLRDRDGLQPLHLAAIHKRIHSPQVIDVLLLAGADPHARACNCYPSFSLWKRHRAMQAIQVMMDMPDGFQPLQQLLEAPAEELSAVDMAVCVSQHVPSVEMFLQHHVMPTEQALELAEKDTPIMRTIVHRPIWNPDLHRLFPDSFKRTVIEMLMCLRRVTGQAGIDLPEHVMGIIIDKLAYPVSAWADSTWLSAQRTRQPRSAPGADVQGPAEGQAAGAQNQAAPPALPQIMGQVLQQLQQGIAGVLDGGQAQGALLQGQVEAEEEDEHGDSDEEDVQPAQEGEQQDFLADLLGHLPAGLPPPQAVHQHVLGNMQVIQMEFDVPFGQQVGGLHPGAFPPPGALPGAFDLPGLVFHAGPAGLFPFPLDMDDDEGDDENELQEGAADNAAPVSPHAADLVPSVSQQNEDGGAAARASLHGEAVDDAGDFSCPAASDSMPPTVADSGEVSTDDEALGPSAQPVRKRIAGSSSSSSRRNLRSHNKRQKRE